MENGNSKVSLIHSIKGGQFGVEFIPRGSSDPHIVIQLLGEDDGNWFRIGNVFSSFWLQDLINVLTEARTALELHGELDKTGFGYTF